MTAWQFHLGTVGNYQREDHIWGNKTKKKKKIQLLFCSHVPQMSVKNFMFCGMSNMARFACKFAHSSLLNSLFCRCWGVDLNFWYLPVKKDHLLACAPGVQTWITGLDWGEDGVKHWEGLCSCTFFTIWNFFLWNKYFG